MTVKCDVYNLDHMFICVFFAYGGDMNYVALQTVDRLHLYTTCDVIHLIPLVSDTNF